MLKLIMCVKRLPTLSREAFDTHWREVHGPLVRSHMQTLGIRRYIQTVPYPDMAAQTALQTGRGSQKVDFDGCAELWWDDLTSHLATRRTEEGLRALKALIHDEETFVDLSASQLWYGTERTVI